MQPRTSDRAVSPACVTCHNSHPESPKKDWQIGDVRGIQAITVEQPIAANLLSFKYLLAYLLAAGGAGVAFVVLQARQARAMRRMNEELETANGFLATVSMKIAKYLSPQVYKSIFSGEKDVAIATERKKLTIFFSDVVNFTQTTDKLALFADTGRVYTLSGDRLPGGRGFGEPVRLQIDLEPEAEHHASIFVQSSPRRAASRPPIEKTCELALFRWRLT